MKAICLATALIAFSAFVVRAKSIPTVKEQLDNLNSCWINKNLNDAVLKEKISLAGDVALIKMHLSLVEKELRCSGATLTDEQKENRNTCLAILHQYAQQGVFPKNLYHQKRTPYFIDAFGTACAVGQLIISTGYNELAQRISRENNYAYIKELNTMYPELKQWADKFGFTVDELAWIQPNYVPCDTACNLWGMVFPNGGTPPYTYLWSNGEITQTVSTLCPGKVYYCQVTDSAGNTLSGNYLSTSMMIISYYGIDSLGISAAYPVYCTVSSTPDDGSCNGTATIKPVEGYGPYSYRWSPGGQTSGTITGLCAGTYWVAAGTFPCTFYDSIVVSLTTTVSENQNSGLMLYPNPAGDEVTIQHGLNGTTNINVIIYDLLGSVVMREKLSGAKAVMNIDHLGDGVYCIVIDNGITKVRQKIVKSGKEN